MAKTGEKAKANALKMEVLTKHTCPKCSQIISVGEMYPIKDGLRRKMLYFHKKCANELYKIVG